MEGLAAAKSRSLQYVFVAAAPDSYREAVKVSAQTVTIIAPGASLRPPGADEPGILVQNGSHLTVEDLRIHEAAGNRDADGIRCDAGGGSSVTVRRVKLERNAGQGLDVTGATLTAERSTINGNTGGGLLIGTSNFTIRNNLIYENGNADAVSGGIIVSGNPPATGLLEFNTLTGNVGPNLTPSGMVCALIATPLTFANNIIYDNQGSTRQVDGLNCGWTYSVIGPAPQTGNGNVNSAPQFVNAGQDDYHIAASSPAKDAADPGAQLAVDFDGDPRPQPTNGRRDIGADEVAQ